MQCVVMTAYTLLVAMLIACVRTQDVPAVVPNFSHWEEVSAPGRDLRLTVSGNLPDYPLTVALIDGATAEYKTLSLIIKLWVLPDSIATNNDISIGYRYIPKQAGKGVHFFIDLTFKETPTDEQIFQYVEEIFFTIMTDEIKIPLPGSTNVRSVITDLYYELARPLSTSIVGGPYVRDKPCNMFNDLGFCSANAECVTPTGNNTLPYCRCLPNYIGESCDQQQFTPLVAGGLAAGAALVFVLLLCAVVFIARLLCCRRHRHQRRKGSRSSSCHSNDPEARDHTRRYHRYHHLHNNNYRRSDREHRTSRTKDDRDRSPVRKNRRESWDRDYTHRFFEPLTLPSHANQWHRRSDSPLYHDPAQQEEPVEDSELGTHVHNPSKKHPPRFPSGALVFYPVEPANMQMSSQWRRYDSRRSSIDDRRIE